MVEGDRLDEDQIAMVIRRATELDGETLTGPHGLDLVLLEEAAVEAGLSRDSVRRAVAELRAGALGADPGPPARRASLGPASVTVARCVPGPFADVDGMLRRFLASEQFHLRRDFGTTSTWTRRQDVRARVRVQVDRSVHRRLVMPDVEQVELGVADEPGERRMVMVKLSVDLKPLRRTHRVAVAKGVGAGVVAGVGAFILGMPEAVVLVPAAASGVALGHRVGVNRYRSQVEEMESRLEGFLDSIERRR